MGLSIVVALSMLYWALKVPYYYVNRWYYAMEDYEIKDFHDNQEAFEILKTLMVDIYDRERDSLYESSIYYYIELTVSDDTWKVKIPLKDKTEIYTPSPQEKEAYNIINELFIQTVSPENKHRGLKSVQVIKDQVIFTSSYGHYYIIYNQNDENPTRLANGFEAIYESTYVEKLDKNWYQMLGKLYLDLGV